jgi:hypothetical protein
MATQPSSSVRVGLRVRPLLSNERHQSIAVQPMDDTSLEFSRSQQTFTYDYVFGMDISQQELYNQTAAPLLKSFMEGYKYVLNRPISIYLFLLSHMHTQTPPHPQHVFQYHIAALR